jgi:hypothetical protein
MPFTIIGGYRNIEPGVKKVATEDQDVDSGATSIGREMSRIPAALSLKPNKRKSVNVNVRRFFRKIWVAFIDFSLRF